MKKSIANFALKAGEGSDTDEYLITRLSKFSPPLNIINVYEKVESRCTKDEIEERWCRLVAEVRKIENRKESFLLIGDMNRHLGDIVRGNHEKISFGGKLIREFLKDTNSYSLLNNSNKVIGGPFTRYDPSKPSDDESKSVLDIIIASKDIEHLVDEIYIDNKLSYTPCRASAGKMCFTDHYGIIVTLKNIPVVTEKVTEPKVVLWNLNKEGGWKSYKELTSKNNALVEVTEKNMSSNDMMNAIEKELNKVRYKAFGKVTYSNNIFSKKCLKEKKNMKEDEMGNREISEKEMSNIIMAEQRASLDKKLSKIVDIKNSKGGCAAIFKLRDDVIGPKKLGQEQTAMIHPESNELIFNKDDIKDLTVKYCADLLTNRNPKRGFEEDIDLKNLVHDIRMLENDNFDLTEEMFEGSLKELSIKKKDKYSFILNGGEDLKKAVFALFKKVWESEIKPESWKKTTIVQLYKGKGDKRSFTNQRNIHTKPEITKVFGHLVMSQIKDRILSNMSKFQIGTKTGHRVQEHLFTLKSIAAYTLHWVSQ